MRTFRRELEGKRVYAKKEKKKREMQDMKMTMTKPASKTAPNDPCFLVCKP